MLDGWRCFPGEIDGAEWESAPVAASRVAGAGRELLVAGGCVDGAGPRVAAGSVGWQTAGAVCSDGSLRIRLLGGVLSGREARCQRVVGQPREDLEHRDWSRGENA